MQVMGSWVCLVTVAPCDIIVSPITDLTDVV